jgi:quinohemoprotein ethanol dehydrogenase
VVAPPVSYAIDGEQYVAVMAGWGGAAGLLNFPGDPEVPIRGRLLVYKLGGQASLPALPEPLPIPEPPLRQGSAESITMGGILYSDNCEICHGIHSAGGTIVTDLRYMGAASHARFEKIVLGGALESVGMRSFSAELSGKEVADIQHYLIEVANLEWEARQPQSWWKRFKARWKARESSSKADAWLRENTPPT